MRRTGLLWIAAAALAAFTFTGCGKKADTPAKSDSSSAQSSANQPGANPPAGDTTTTPGGQANTGTPGASSTPQKTDEVSAEPAGTVVKSGPVSLRFHFAKGDKLVYDQSVSIASQSPAGSVNAKMSATENVDVQDSAAKGVTVNTSMANVKIEMPNAPKGTPDPATLAKGMEGHPSTSVVDSLGHASSGAGGNSGLASMSSALGDGFLGLVLSKGPVHAGSTWHSTIDPTKAMRQMNPKSRPTVTGVIDIAYTLERFESANGKTIAVITYKSSGTVKVKRPPLPKGVTAPKGLPDSVSSTVSGGGTVRFDTTAGRITSETLDFTMTREGGGQKSTQHITGNVRLKS